MALVTLKSTLITNRDAVPKVQTDAQISGGAQYESYGWVFTGAADNAGSAYKLCQVPSGARLSNLEYVENTLGSGRFLDVTVWYPTAVPSGGGAFLAQSVAGTIISSSNFKTNIANASQTSWTTLMDTANTTQTVNWQEMPLWQMIGLTTDPEINLDIGFTLRVATAAAGYIGLKARYIA